MQDYGLVSIITPNWNCSKYIGETIRSVQAQTYRNWEMIIVDDCSKDGSESVVLPFLQEDSRIKFIKNEKNKGAAICRNKALSVAKGRWIAFLDSDDLWTEEKLELQLEFMVSNGYRFSYTKYSEIDSNSQETGVMISGPKRVPRIGMHAFCWPGCLTVMYNREAIGLIQIADIKKNNDYAMWLKICQKADLYLLDKCLAKYRRGRVGSISSQKYKILILWHFKLWHEAEGKNYMESYFLTGLNLVCGVVKKILYVKKK